MASLVPGSPLSGVDRTLRILNGLDSPPVSQDEEEGQLAVSTAQGATASHKALASHGRPCVISLCQRPWWQPAEQDRPGLHLFRAATGSTGAAGSAACWRRKRKTTHPAYRTASKSHPEVPCHWVSVLRGRGHGSWSGGRCDAGFCRAASTGHGWSLLSTASTRRTRSSRYISCERAPGGCLRRHPRPIFSVQPLTQDATLFHDQGKPPKRKSLRTGAET